MGEDILDLGERIAEMAAHLDAATHQLLTDLREFDAQRGWYRAGAKDCAEWLSWRVGWSRGTARQHVAVAQKLGELPLIDEALRTGEISYCKVRAMTRVATKLNEKLLLESARLMTGAQLERVCRKYATIQRHGAEQSAQQPNRYVRKRYLDDGMVRIEAVLHPEEAAIVWAALDRAATELFNSKEPYSDAASTEPAGTAQSQSTSVSAETTATASAACVSPEPTAPAAAESVSAETIVVAPAEPAIVSAETIVPAPDEPASVSAETTVAALAPIMSVSAETTVTALAPTVSVSAETSALRRKHFDRADALLAMARQFTLGEQRHASPVELIVTVPVAALGQGVGLGLENLGLLPDGEGIAPETCCRLACDAGVRFVVEDEAGLPLSVGRRTRTLPTAMKRAMLERDRKCCFPGCNNRLFLHGHHMKHWAHGGETNLENLCALCDHHHRFVHEFGYRVERGTDGRPLFYDPHGRLVKEVPDRFQSPELGWPTLRRTTEALGITASTNAPRWDGRPVAYLDVVGQLSRADQRWYADHPLYGLASDAASDATASVTVEPDGYVEPQLYDLGPDEWSLLAQSVSAETI